MTRTFAFAAAGMTVLLVCAVSEVPVGAAKPAPAPVNWSCTITFDGTLTYTDPSTGATRSVPTALQEDGLGPYVDGEQMVKCYINQASGSGNYQNLFVNADSRSLRYLFLPGQGAVTTYTRQGYLSFENRQPGYFDITQIDTVRTPGVTERRRIRIGMGGSDEVGGLMRGDSLSSDPMVVGSSSAWITPLTFNTSGAACSWSIRFYPFAAVEAGDTGAIAGTRIVALEEGTSFKNRSRTADFAFPLSATVRIKPGTNGCS